LTSEERDDCVADRMEAREIFDFIRYIKDSEHPSTLEELNVVDESNIEVDDEQNYMKVMFTPTVGNRTLHVQHMKEFATQRQSALKNFPVLSI